MSGTSGEAPVATPEPRDAITAAASDPAPVAATPARGRRRAPWLVLTSLGVVVAAIVAIIGSAGRAHGSDRTPVIAVPRPTEVLTVAPRPLVRAVRIEGELVPYASVEMRPKIAGFVETMAVDVGDAVKPGQVLAELEVPNLANDIARARATVTRDQDGAEHARATYEEAHQTWQRLAQVARQRAGLIAQQDLDEAKARDASTLAAWNAAKAQRGVSQADLDKLIADDAFRKIAAPFAGIITKRFADPGALVNGGVGASAQGMPLVTLCRTDLLRLKFPVPEQLTPKLHVGDAIRIAIPCLDAEVAGTVARTSGRIDDATRTLAVEADVANADGRLTAGMYATVTVTVDRREKALAVPLGAVHRDGAKASLLVVRADHALERRPVTLGLENADDVEIVEGISAGETIVSASNRARAGDVIEPIGVGFEPAAQAKKAGDATAVR